MSQILYPDDQGLLFTNSSMPGFGQCFSSNLFRSSFGAIWFSYILAGHKNVRAGTDRLWSEQPTEFAPELEANNGFDDASLRYGGETVTWQKVAVASKRIKREGRWNNKISLTEMVYWLFYIRGLLWVGYTTVYLQSQEAVDWKPDSNTSRYMSFSLVSWITWDPGGPVVWL